MNSYEKLHPLAKKLWVIHGIIAAVIVLGSAVAAGFLFKFWWQVLPAAILSIYWVFLWPAWEMAQWRYLVTTEQVETIHGIFFRTHTVIPINRIQHMDIRQGPLQKKFELAKLTVYTAASVHQIPALSMDIAEQITAELGKAILTEEP